MNDRWVMGAALVVILLAGCGGDDDAKGEDAGSVDAGGGGDAGAVDSGPPVLDDCGGSDALEIHVVDHRVLGAEPEPLAEAIVVADCADGRLVGTTNATGIVRFEGLDLDGDPPTLTAFHSDFPAHTRVAVGAAARGRPYVFPMRDIFIAAGTSASVDVTLTHGTDGAGAFCMVEGMDTVPFARRWSPHIVSLFVPPAAATTSLSFYPGGGTRRLGCVEIDGGGAVAADRTLLSFAEAEVEGDEAIDLTFPSSAEIERFTVQLRFAAGGVYAADRFAEAVVYDPTELGHTVPIGMLEAQETTGDVDDLQVAWVPGAALHEPRVMVFASAQGGAYGWKAPNVAPEDTTEPIVVGDPVYLARPFDLDDPSVELLGADWADEIGLFVWSAAGDAWFIFVPAGAFTFTIPAPPPGRTYADVLPTSTSLRVNAFAWAYDTEPPPDHWIREFWNEHAIASSRTDHTVVVAE